MEIVSIDDNETIAIMKLPLESFENYFVSYNLLVLDTDNEWKLINNLADVEKKKQYKNYITLWLFASRTTRCNYY